MEDGSGEDRRRAHRLILDAGLDLLAPEGTEGRTRDVGSGGRQEGFGIADIGRNAVVEGVEQADILRQDIVGVAGPVARDIVAQAARDEPVVEAHLVADIEAGLARFGDGARRQARNDGNVAVDGLVEIDRGRGAVIACRAEIDILLVDAEGDLVLKRAGERVGVEAHVAGEGLHVRIRHIDDAVDGAPVRIDGRREGRIHRAIIGIAVRVARAGAHRPDLVESVVEDRRHGRLLGVVPVEPGFGQEHAVVDLAVRRREDGALPRQELR